jgi:hypothetical protein
MEILAVAVTTIAVTTTINRQTKQKKVPIFLGMPIN